LLKRCDAGLTVWIVCGAVHKQTDPPQLLGLLCLHGERPRHCCTGDNGDELAPPHNAPEAQDKAS
jgi:hypothetical protein